MDTQANRILAVIDPTRVGQWALQKTVTVARRLEGSKIFAFLCVYSEAKCDDPQQLKEAELRRHRLWFDEMLEGYADAGVPIEPIIVWNPDWREAICEAAKDTGVRLVVKRASGRPKSLGNSDRQLIRNLQKSTLLLVKHEPTVQTKKILVAVDFNAMDASHTALNEAIMALGKSIRGDRTDIELHAVSAYPESDKFVHPPDVAKTLGIRRSQAHVRQGAAAAVIPDMANKIQADLVIVGNVGRRGISGITIGNTAEKILADIDADVLVLVRESTRERSAA